MRAIPSELLDRVKKKWQVPAENSGPDMKVYLSRGFINELFQVFTIQEGAELTDVDVTVKRTDTSAEPAEAFALAINDGVAQVKSKPLPYDDQIPWVSEFTVASGVSSVAIEFDGYWDRDYAMRRFNFVTEEYPWLFYVQGGTLYAKYWEDAEITLATDVAKVCAIRGWLPANGDQSNDQGLIVAYIKTDGLVYYRTYCIQVGGGKLWEVERNVAEVMAVATDLALFRTNDFRIGFLVTIGGAVYWLLTERNWAGMSIWPDRATLSISNIVTSLIPIEYLSSTTEEHGYSNLSFASREMEFCHINIPEPTLDDIERIDENTVKLTFNLELINLLGTENAWIISGPSGTVSISSVAYGVSLNVAMITHASTAKDADLTVSYSKLAGNIRTNGSASCRRFVDNFSVVALGLPSDGFGQESMTLNISNIAATFITIEKISSESGNAYPTIGISNVTCILRNLDGTPV